MILLIFRLQFKPESFESIIYLENISSFRRLSATKDSSSLGHIVARQLIIPTVHWGSHLESVSGPSASVWVQ